MWSHLLVLCAAAFVLADVSYNPLKPPSYPLAVRNPYLSAWIPGNSVENIATTRPQFWAGNLLTWGVMARIDSTTYNLFGIVDPPADSQDATLVSANYTASHTIFVVDAGEYQISLDFFSPITPNDYVRQSMPFSYLTVTMLGDTDGKTVQIYSDIDDSWNGQNLELFDQTSSWNSTISGSTMVWQINNVDGIQYSQGGPNGDMALWGSAIYASKPGSTSVLTSAAGLISTLRSGFTQQCVLSGLGENPDWSSGGGIGFSHDLGTNIGGSVTFAIGYYRNCDVNYLGACRVGYYRSEYADHIAAVTSFLDDYEAAYSTSLDLDTHISNRAIKAASKSYADIVTLSARQTFGSLDETIPASTLDTDDHMVFMKEISSDGNVNTMDVIFPAFPQFYVLNSEYIRLLLEPVVQYLESGRWEQNYCIHDVGANYPNATGHDNQSAEPMPVEESGNMLILAYIYSQVTNSTDWVSQHQALFKTYADYLVNHGLYPSTQLSTDDAAGAAPNQTNLAIKAAVALTSFGDLFNLHNYTTIGRQFATTLYDDGLGTDASKTHFTLEYGQESTWTTTFNLYPDVLMGLETFNTSAYKMQSAWYPTVRSDAGVALDSNLTWAKTDWQLWAAASSASDTTMNMFIDDLHAYLENDLNTVAFSDRYTVTGDSAGQYFDYINRPVVGGEWCLIALDGPL